MASSKLKDIVVQSNKLIEAHYRLTLQEKRLILWLIKEIRPFDTDFKKYELKIADFAAMVELNSKTQYKEMKKVTRALLGRIIEIENLETKATTQMSWLCFAHWEPNKGTVYLEFHPALKPYLLQLQDQFTQIGFADLLGLKSVYSVRLFELLAQYKTPGKRTITIENLRSWCGLTIDEYPLYGDVKRRIIDRATSEINAKTEYDVAYVEKKESRKVVAIEWTIKKKTHFEKSQIERATILQKELRSKNALIEAIMEYGFSQTLAKKLINGKEEEHIRDAIRAVDKQIDKGGVKNSKGMLRTAIEGGWKPDKFRTKKK